MTQDTLTNLNEVADAFTLKIDKVKDEGIDEVLKRLQNEIKETQSGIEEQEQLQRLCEAAKNFNGDDRLVSFEELEEEIKNEPPALKISSNVSDLDKLLHGGFMTGTVTTLSATPKSGKTSYCMFLTQQMSQYNPMWLALEESAKSLIRKMINRGHRAPKGYAPKQNKVVTLNWVQAKIIEAVVKHNTKVVFIDQLDFVVSQDSGDRHDLKVAQAMRELHQMAVKWDVAIFLICHLEKIEPDQKPTVKNFRGASAIWGESDNCILLWRECKREQGELIYSNNVLVMLQANREDGDTGNVKMIYEDGVFKARDWEDAKFGDFSDYTNKPF